METTVNQLKKAASFLNKKGFLLPGSSSGNISMRNPDNPESMIITLSGESLDFLKEGCESFCEVPLAKQESPEDNCQTIDWTKWDLKTPGLNRKAKHMLIPGTTFTMTPLPLTKQGKSSFETFLHSEIYEHIKQANAVVHLHSPNSTNFACLQPKIIMRLRKHCQSSFPAYDRSNIIPYINVARVAKCGPILWCPHFPAASNELHDYLWRALKTNESLAIILQNHGVVSIGLTIMEAAMVAAEIEQELGIILDTFRISGGNFHWLHYLPAEDVEWYWKNISKGNPWKKLYSR
ncbi:MAG TPA: class II aldolase/adducin family protein [Bacillota bacterium]|nr:class II aldolase/adducin family protein [Bacillota bacterium]